MQFQVSLIFSTNNDFQKKTGSISSKPKIPASDFLEITFFNFPKKPNQSDFRSSKIRTGCFDTAFVGTKFIRASKQPEIPRKTKPNRSQRSIWEKRNRFKRANQKFANSDSSDFGFFVHKLLVPKYSLSSFLQTVYFQRVFYKKATLLFTNDI